MEETKEPRRSNRAASIIVAVLVAVFVLYPLSIGPAVAISRMDLIDQERVTPLYWPVATAARKLGLKDALRAYIGWWLSLVD